MGLRVGIDLGTTNSAAAIVNDSQCPVIIPNDSGDRTTPSVIAFHNGQIFIGKQARLLSRSFPLHVASSFKRNMGERFYAFPGPDQSYSATGLSALLLEKMKKDMETRLGQAVTDAVITVPAYFRNPQREATKQAGRLAGLNVLQIINEPTAAAIAYGMLHGTKEQNLLVYDLGGGTFDVTLLKTANGEINILNSEGDIGLGGDDWDNRLLDYCCDRLLEEYAVNPKEDKNYYGELKSRIEELKKELSEVSETALNLTANGRRISISVDRAIFKSITSDLLERTLNIVRKALHGAGLSERDIDGILLVGGSTRMQMVHETIKEVFQQEPKMGVNPDEAVALGAAIVATSMTSSQGVLAGHTPQGLSLKITDITNHSLGMIALNEQRTAYVNSRILSKNTALPCSSSREYTFKATPAGPNCMEVFMTQGESESPSEVDYIGLYVFNDIPYIDEGNVIIKVTYTYDVSGTLQVNGVVRSSGADLPVTVQSIPDDVPDRFLQSPKAEPEIGHTTIYLALDVSGSMSGSPIRDARNAMQQLLTKLDTAIYSLGIIVFSDKTRLILDASNVRHKIANAIESLEPGTTGWDNRTDPFQRIRSCFKDSTDTRKVAIILTDGVWSYQERAIHEAKQCHQAGIEIIAVGFGDADKRFLKQIASSELSGIFTSQNHLADTFGHIAQELNQQRGIRAG